MLHSLTIAGFKTAPDRRFLPLDEPATDPVMHHRIVAITVIEADMTWAGDPTRYGETYTNIRLRQIGAPDMDDTALVTAFWASIQDRQARLILWNSDAADRRALVTKAIHQRIQIPGLYLSAPRWPEIRTPALAHDWTADLRLVLGQPDTASPAMLAETVGLTVPAARTPAENERLIAAGNLAQVRADCDADTIATAALYLRWAHQAGFVSAEDHDATVDGLRADLDRHASDHPHLGTLLAGWSPDRAYIGAARTAPLATAP